MTDKNQKHLEIMKDIYTVSTELGIKSYVWGGFAADILNGNLTREHGDLDLFTENLVQNKDILTQKYETLGYEVKYLENFWMLQIYKGDIHAAFNSVRNVGGIAHWHHCGPHGTVFFPYEWLDKEPSMFYGSPVYTIGAELAYILKTNVKLLNPEWEAKGLRDKDRADIETLERILSSRGVNKDEIKKKVWSHNPIWYAKGYEEYYYPILL